MKTQTKRVVYRPGLTDFLLKCFNHFEVSFWDSKSAMYMGDIVPAMLWKVEGDKKCMPLFVWSQQEYEPIEFKDGAPTLWGKPLRRVFDQWPQWNNSNTVIIDHKLDRVGCNHGNNVIVTKPFYIADLEKLGDDRLHLKTTVWPLLQKLASSEDVRKFRKQFRKDMAAVGITQTQLTKSGTEAEFVAELQGEGTCGPTSSYCKLSPHLAFNVTSDCAICYV
jgi:hypothetical protein